MSLFFLLQLVLHCNGFLRPVKNAFPWLLFPLNILHKIVFLYLKSLSCKVIYSVKVRRHLILVCNEEAPLTALMKFISSYSCRCDGSLHDFLNTAISLFFLFFFFPSFSLPLSFLQGELGTLAYVWGFIWAAIDSTQRHCGVRNPRQREHLLKPIEPSICPMQSNHLPEEPWPHLAFFHVVVVLF